MERYLLHSRLPDSNINFVSKDTFTEPCRVMPDPIPGACVLARWRTQVTLTGVFMGRDVEEWRPAWVTDGRTGGNTSVST